GPVTFVSPRIEPDVSKNRMSSLKDLSHLKLMYQDIASATNRFAHENMIREYRFGKIFKGRLLHSGQFIDIIVKRFCTGCMKHESKSIFFLTEISTLSSLKHKNLLSLVGFCDEKSVKGIIYKKEADKRLEKYLSDETLTWMQRLKICVGVANALSYIHYDAGRDFSVIHCNIGSSEILLDDKWEPKLSGFEVLLKNTVARRHRLLLTRDIIENVYLDPKYKKTGGMTHKSDVYSFGVVLLEVLCGRSAVSLDEQLGEGFLSQLTKSHLDEMVDLHLRRQMDPESFKVFSETTYWCIKKDRADDQVVKRLEKALEIQWKHENPVKRTSSIQFKGENLEHLKIELNDIIEATKNFDDAYIIGSGGFGNVYIANLEHFDSSNSSLIEGVDKCDLPKKRSTVAIKRIYNQKGERGFITEIETLTSCKHENIISLLGFCYEGSGAMILVYEHASKGSLEDYLGSSDKMTNLTWVQRIKICLDIAHGLKYIHTNTDRDKQKIIHRDIKSANILLADNWKAKIQLTAPYSPQQNGVVERRNRTIMSTTRCMMKATEMPQDFWAEAVRHAIYILNSVPTKALEDITPYEAIKGKKPNLKDLRIFGCIAYAKVPTQHLTKLDDRSIKMIYLGNEQGSKAYRLFDPITQRICVSRDVKFKENETWDWKDYMFRIENLEHHDHEIQPLEEDNEFPNNDNDDYASPRNSPTHSQPLHTPSTRSSEINSQVTPINSPPSYYQSDNDSIQVINTPSHFDHTPVRGFRTLNDLYENTEELLLAEDEPKNYKEASTDQKWIKAMKVELDSINRNNTWELTTLPKGHKAIGLKWVFKTKKDANGNIVKHKARLVAKGYIQEHGIDFEEVFAPSGLEFLDGTVSSLEMVIHRDINSSNILLLNDWKAKISDFGLSIVCPTNQDVDYVIDNVTGTIGYCDPLHSKTGFLTKESDIFSLGAVLFDILCGKLSSEKLDDEYLYLPFLAKYHYHVGKLDKLVFEGIKEQIVPESYITFTRIALQCLHHMREGRPTANEVVIQLKKALEFQFKYKKQQDEYNQHVFFRTQRYNRHEITWAKMLRWNEDVVIEFILESFSSYYCGDSVIYVEGIEFQAIENVTHDNIGKFNEVPQVLKSNFSLGQQQQFPTKFKEIFKKYTNYGELFWLGNVNGKKFLILSAKAAIYKFSNVNLYSSRRSAHSRFKRVIELLPQQVFHINCTIESQNFSPDTEYVCYLLFKLSENCQGMHCPVKVRDVLHLENNEAEFFYFITPSQLNINGITRVPKQMEDGWMEIQLWKFNSTHEIKDDSLSMNMKFTSHEGIMSGLIVPRVLVTCRSRREEFCLVTGLRFGVEYSSDYNNEDEPIPFRRRVFRLEDRRRVPDWILRLANDRDGWDNFPWGSYVWPTLYSQLRDANVRRWPSLYATEPRRDVDKETYSIFGFTWAFKGRLLAERLTPDETEARSEWWVSSRALEEIMKKNVEREDTYEQMRKFMEDMKVSPVRQANKGPIIVGQHYGLRDFSDSKACRGLDRVVRLLSRRRQTTLSLKNRARREPRPSIYRQSPYMDLPPTTELPKKWVDKTKKKRKNANLSPMNLGYAFADDNEGGDDVMITGEHETGIYFTYENVDPNKIMSKEFAHLKVPFEDIISATSNFAQENVIRNSGFAKEYKGQLLWSGELIHITARRFSKERNDREQLFWMEISMLSTLKHKNLVSIVGFCDENDEKIIINRNETARGMLSNYLSDSMLLTWVRRLEICVRLAHALSYIHYDEPRDFSVIHRVIDSSRVLLNDEWEPKKSIIDDEGNRHLAPLAVTHYRDKRLDEIIDWDLWNQMDSQSFNIFAKTAYHCLNEERSQRPNIDEIVTRLEKALELQLEHQKAVRRFFLFHLSTILSAFGSRLELAPEL
ncbi:kinase-like domain, phloem protein 2-like protein, partial [Tanacetum coccineum]